MRSFAIALAAVLLAASPASADEREPYTGKWILNAKESKGERPSNPPVFVEMTLKLEGENLNIKRRNVLKNGKMQNDAYTYECNGEPQDIQVGDDPKRTANAQWDGADLKIHSVATQMGTEFTIDTVWTLKSNDRIEIENDLKHPLSERKWTDVYLRKGVK